MKKLLTILILVLLFVLSGCYSCGSYHKWKGTGTPPSWIEDKVYWSPECKVWAASLKEPAPAPVESKPATVKPKPAPASECGPFTVSRSYPCGGCGVIQLDKTMPKEVQLNAPFDYTIKVANLTDMMVADIVVTENLPGNFKFSKANPDAKKEGNKLVWKMDSLGPKESRQVTVSGTPTNTDCLKHCATVTYVVPACANVKVVEPELNLVKTAPAEVLLCDPIPVKFVVTNSGTGSAQNVKVEDTLPAGLQTTQGQGKLVFNAGTLASGQSRQFTATLKAEKTGKYVNKAVASSEDGLKAESETTTIVRQPILTISKTGPEMRYLGRPVNYVINITNKGDAIAENLTLEDKVPSGMTFVSANHGGTFSNGKVVWNLPRLSPNKSHSVEVAYSTDREGTFSNTATARAKCAKPVTASVKTTVKGIAAVLLEVIDIEDPIELGSRETYVITATNQGTTDDTNIKIVCTLEETVEYYSSSGPTTASVKDRVVTFAPLPRLAPKAKATWKVVVKALKAGDVRFSVEMNTDQLKRPVNETESTELYE